MDAKLVVDSISSTQREYSEYGIIIEDCRSLIRRALNFSTVHVHRSANKAAHHLPLVTDQVKTCGAMLQSLSGSILADEAY